MKTAAEQLNQKDEYTIFGQLVGHKIRKLNPCNRLIAQQRINNILFELEMEQIKVHDTNTEAISVELVSSDVGYSSTQFVSETQVDYSKQTDLMNHSQYVVFKETPKITEEYL